MISRGHNKTSSSLTSLQGLEGCEVILYRPQIPQNTGNIVRTCHASSASLGLVKPLGFKTDDKSLKRAGLDYWQEVKIRSIDHLPKLLEETNSPFYFFSSKGKHLYTDINFSENSLLIFGSETEGLPSFYYERWPHLFYTIPMLPRTRCLNLSNAVAIVLYEAWRQRNFVLIAGKKIENDRKENTKNDRSCERDIDEKISIG
ncbi:MAG: tRNA (cytidine(34)-2'-O)-methyltransferase [Simkania negevensis]|nr:tRNA (cytidine(34)-2'-O)-methyltransferase [Simkania negevensis]